MYLHFAIIYTLAVIANCEILTQYRKPSTKQQPLDLNEIISNKIEDAKPYLADGVPGLFIPSFKHMVIPFAVTEKSNYEIMVWNYNITGLENFSVLKVDVDQKNNLFKLQLDFPYAEANGKYGFKGNLFNMIFDGTGPIHCHATNFILNFELKTELVHRNGHDYLQQVYKKFKVTTDSTFYIYFHNLYYGNAKITDIMNGVFNNNSYYMFDLIVPIFETHLDGIFDKAIEKVFNTYTYDELML